MPLLNFFIFITYFLISFVFVKAKIYYIILIVLFSLSIILAIVVLKLSYGESKVITIIILCQIF